MAQLTDEQFRVTMAGSMRQVRVDSALSVDFWFYFDTISEWDFVGHRCDGTVTYVYRSDRGRYEHVLVDTEDENVFMAIVVDLTARNVVGHRLLNLNALYGLTDAS